MSTDFHIIIPARLNATRLPQKLLLTKYGQSILEWVFQRCLAASPKSLTIATDAPELYSLARSFGADVVMTADTHPSGSDRIAEAARILGLGPQDIIVNVQGDEPEIAPQSIIQVAQLLQDSEANWATLCWPITELSDYLNPNVVKVTMNEAQEALYFSRSPLPYHRQAPQQLPKSYRHLGLYAYRHDSLQRWVEAGPCALEHIEALEQLRALHLGMKIKLQVALHPPGQDINTLEDYQSFLAKI